MRLSPEARMRRRIRRLLARLLRVRPDDVARHLASHWDDEAGDFACQGCRVGAVDREVKRLRAILLAEESE